MDPEKFKRIREIFVQASRLEGAERAEFLQSECGSEPEVLAEVKSLLEFDVAATTPATVKPTIAIEQQPTEEVGRHLSAHSHSQLAVSGTHAAESGKRTAFAIGTTLLVVAAVLGWAYFDLRSSIRELRENELEIFIDADVAAIKAHLQLEETSLLRWTERPEFRKAVSEAMQTGSSEAIAAQLSAYAADRKGPSSTPPDTVDFVIWNDSQQVVAASANRSDAVGKNCSVEGAGLLLRVFSGELVISKPVLQDKNVAATPFDLPTPQMGCAIPIYSADDDSEVIAALFVHGTGIEERFFELLQGVRSGDSGETYAFDKDAILISESRFNDQLRELGIIEADGISCLNVQIRDPGGNLTQGFVADSPVAARPKTKMAAYATVGENGQDLDGYRDYRGVMVVGAWEWLPKYDFGVTTEVDYDEVYSTMRPLNIAFTAIALLFCGAVGAIGWSNYRVRQARQRSENTREVGLYTLSQKLGEGGMGEVYLGLHALLKRPAAVKLLKSGQDNERARARFEREVQLASRLAHPNTIEIYDYGRTLDGTFYYAMEYVSGITLGQLTSRHGETPANRVIHILKAICASLREAHAAGLVHRDIKPQNIMLCERGGEFDVVKVLDFGLCNYADGSEATKLTRTGGIIGTPLYIDPERMKDPAFNDPRSDIYSLGAVAFNLLTATEIFPSSADMDIYYHVLNTVPPEVQRLVPSVPEELSKLIAACLAKDPQARPQNIAAVLATLNKMETTWSPDQAEAWWADQEAQW